MQNKDLNSQFPQKLGLSSRTNQMFENCDSKDNFRNVVFETATRDRKYDTHKINVCKAISLISINRKKILET